MPERATGVLAFDYGLTKVGVAVGNTVSGTATALTIIEYRALSSLFDPIARLIADWSPAQLVVGRPLDPDGRATVVTAGAERFARRMHGRFGVPVALVDERFSSVAAQQELAELARSSSLDEKGDARGGGKGSRHARRALARGADDAQAAAIILRQYLAGHSDHR